MSAEEELRALFVGLIEERDRWQNKALKAMSDIEGLRRQMIQMAEQADSMDDLVGWWEKRAKEAEADLRSLTRELSVICGGAGKPRKGETLVAYWLRRVGETLAQEAKRIKE